jgi:ribonuclease P protein component
LSIARAITSFTKQEIYKLYRSAVPVFKDSGLEIKRASKTLDYARILIVIPRASGIAPERNKFKRQLKSIFYEQKLFKKNYDLIIIVRKEGISAPFQELMSLLIKAEQ